MKHKIKIGISVGDINGVGLEVILKTFADERLLNYCTPIIYGSAKVVAYHKNIVNLNKFSFHNIQAAEYAKRDRVNVITCWEETVNIALGKMTKESGEYAYKSLQAVMHDLKENKIDALVTAPINKKAMQGAGFDFPGHTEYIASQFTDGRNLMLMVNDDLRVGLVTNHVPLRDVAGAITREVVSKKIQIFNETLKIDFGKERPTIAVLGLNPHAGDDGVLGQEEEKIIRPAIIEAKKKGIMVFGCYPADGFFGSGNYTKFDGILAMYHDQGLVPFKALSFGDGVNYTAGLPVVRTSPDHGTAYDIAGQNAANPASFRKALFLAMDIAKNRRNFTEMRANPLKKTERPDEAKNESKIENIVDD